MKSESPTQILNFLASVYPTEESQPNYICIDKACQALHTSINNGSWGEWQKTTRIIVDAFHYKNHSILMFYVVQGSAPNSVIPAVDKNGQPCFKQAFNTQVSYL